MTKSFETIHNKKPGLPEKKSLTGARRSFGQNVKSRPAAEVQLISDGPVSSDVFIPTPANDVEVFPRQEQRRAGPDTSAASLGGERWSGNGGHALTYIGLVLFTFTLYFRPYELIPGLSEFNSLALVLGIITLLIYIPTQISIEGSLTFLSVEVKCILFLALWAFITIPIAKDPFLAWESFIDPFLKIVLIFVVMVNTLRSKRRLEGLMWLGVGVGAMLSIQAANLYLKGEFKTEGYRVSVNFGGMFGNPNDMAIHLVMFAPIALVLGIAARNAIAKLILYLASLIMVFGIMVTQSRGAFLGLLVVAGVLAWKLGRKNRLKVIAFSAVLMVGALIVAPGNYGIRVLSIFDSSLDPNGSSTARSDLLQRSILVTLRNPAGIGMGNFQVVGIHNQQTHNSYTQVSSELGWLALVAYVILLVSPLRKLGLIERAVMNSERAAWMYYQSVGVQAAIAGYMVSSFFGPVAYQWYMYYPIAFAIALRRIYQTQNESNLPVATYKE